MMTLAKIYSNRIALPVVSCFVVCVSLSNPAWGGAPSSEPQSRPPVSSGASGGANPGNSGSAQNPGGSDYNPGNGGSGQNPGGSGYNPGHGGSGQNPGHGGGYNPGGSSRHHAIVFRDSNFRGGSARYDGEIADLRNSGLNDEISSMRLQGVWLACTDSYFRGRCEVFRNSIRDLRQSGMNDRISSLRPMR